MFNRTDSPDLPDRVIVGIRQVEVGAVSGDAIGIIEQSGAARAICAAMDPCGACQGGHSSCGDSDSADRVVTAIREVEVGAVSGDAIGQVEPSAAARTVCTS